MKKTLQLLASHTGSDVPLDGSDRINGQDLNGLQHTDNKWCILMYIGVVTYNPLIRSPLILTSVPGHSRPQRQHTERPHALDCCFVATIRTRSPKTKVGSPVISVPFAAKTPSENFDRKQHTLGEIWLGFFVGIAFSTTCTYLTGLCGLKKIKSDVYK